MDQQTMMLLGLGALAFVVMQGRGTSSSTEAYINRLQGELGDYRRAASRRSTEYRFGSEENRDAYTRYAEARAAAGYAAARDSTTTSTGEWGAL